MHLKEIYISERTSKNEIKEVGKCVKDIISREWIPLSDMKNKRIVGVGIYERIPLSIGDYPTRKEKYFFMLNPYLSNLSDYIPLNNEAESKKGTILLSFGSLELTHHFVIKKRNRKYWCDSYNFGPIISKGTFVRDLYFFISMNPLEQPKAYFMTTDTKLLPVYKTDLDRIITLCDDK